MRLLTQINLMTFLRLEVRSVELTVRFHMEIESVSLDSQTCLDRQRKVNPKCHPNLPRKTLQERQEILRWHLAQMKRKSVSLMMSLTFQNLRKNESLYNCERRINIALTQVNQGANIKPDTVSIVL